MDGVVNRVGSALAWLWYAALFAAGSALILWSSPWGIGIRVDSLSYLTAAKSLAEGKCLCWLGSGLELKPLVHFAPAYPVLIAGVSRVMGDLFGGARLVSAALFGANLALSGFFTHKLTGRFWAGVLASVLLGVSPAIVVAHDSAMSEPLFLVLLLAAMASLAVYLRGGRRRHLLLAAAASALAVLTRYAGASLLAAAALGILLLTREGLRRGLSDALVFGLGAAGPLAVWLVRNLSVAGTATNRILSYHPVTIEDARRFLDVVTAWVTEAKPSHWLEGGALLALMGLLAWVLGRGARRQPADGGRGAAFGFLWLAYAALYVPYLALSRTLFDAKIPIDDRMLSPFYAALTFALCAALGTAVARGRRSWAPLIVAVALVGALGVRMIPESASGLARLRSEGVGFSSRAWRQSDSLEWARRLPAEATLFSNKAHVIQLLIGRPAFQLPERYDEVKAEPRTDFEDGLARMYEVLMRPNSYLLYFDPEKPVDPFQIDDEFTIGLETVLRTEDGVVLARSSEARLR